LTKKCLLRGAIGLVAVLPFVVGLFCVPAAPVHAGGISPVRLIFNEQVRLNHGRLTLPSVSEGSPARIGADLPAMIEARLGASLPKTAAESRLEAVRTKLASVGMRGWLDQDARRRFRIINALAVLITIGLLCTSYFLRYRLKEKVASLKTAQQELLAQNELLRLAMDATYAGIWDFYPARGSGYLGEQLYTMLGYRPIAREVSLDEWRGFIHPEDLPVAEKRFSGYINAGGQGLFETEFRIRRADGTWCWVLSKGQAVARDRNGVPTRYIGLILNIQSMKETQEVLAQSEARFRAIFEYAPYSIFINGLDDGRLLDANRAFLDARGIGKEELSRLTVKDFEVFSEIEAEHIIALLMKTGSVRNFETPIRAKDGSERHIIFSSVLLEIQEKRQVLTMTADVTERKRAEKALKESEERFRSLFKNAPLPLAYVSLDGRVIEVNDRFSQALGYSRNDIPTIDHWWRLAYPDPEYRDQLRSRWRTVIDEVLTTGSEVEPGEFRVTCKDGTVRTMIIGANLIGDSIIVSIFDITDRKLEEEEREKLQGQLLQSRKLEAVGVLAGGVAHDFNNMLGAIIGYAELTMDSMDEADPLRENLGRILDAAERSARLTRQLLAFARKQTVTPVVFDLNESVAATLKMLRRLIGENITLAWLPGAGPCTVKMDPSQLDQILANLCVNARDAIADVGKISIETHTASFGDNYREINSEVLPGEYVVLAVSDDGCGMDKENLDRIFEPFFTTKELGQGTGLGLATVYGIVKQNEGFIHVYSEPGHGTTFKIFIPRHGSEAGEIKTAAAVDIPRSRGETILIVEDEPAILEMGKKMLQHLGYTVLSAGTPGEAIEIAREDLNGIDLFITDVVMPEMNGRDLAARLQAVRPTIKHLFMSGYTSDVIAHRGVLDNGVNFIQKPFSLKELAVRVREVLD